MLFPLDGWRPLHIVNKFPFLIEMFYHYGLLTLQRIRQTWDAQSSLRILKRNSVRAGQAGVLLQNRNAEEAAMVRLIAQMQAYKAGTSPFEVPFLGGCDVRNWWLTVQMDKAPELVAIARQVVSACPVSASVDEVFRKAGWRLPPIPICPPGIDPAIVGAIHTFYENKPPRCVPLWHYLRE